MKMKEQLMSSSALKNSLDDKRMDRLSYDTGSGEKRIHQNVPLREGRGQFVNYYEDLGLSTTPESATAIRDEEATFQSQLKEEKGNIATATSALKDAQSKLSQAKSSLMNYDQAMDHAWNSFKSQTPYTTVTVKGIGQEPDRTYSFPTQYKDYVMSGGGGTTGIKNRATQVNDALYSTFTDKYSGTIKQQVDQSYKDYNQASGIVSQRADEIEAANIKLKGIETQRQDMWDAAHAKYQNRLNVMSDIMNNFKVEKPSE